MEPSSALRFTARDLAQVAVFAALIIVLGFPGQFTIGTAGVPITLQTLGVMLAGSILGLRKGLAAVLVVIVLSLVLPVLAGWRTGLTSLAGPTAGYLIGWIPAVAVIGGLTALMMPRYRFWLGLLINLFGGLVVIYAFGVAGLMIRADLSFTAALATNTAYLPGDVLKAVVAAAVAAPVHRAYPGLIRPLRPAATE